MRFSLLLLCIIPCLFSANELVGQTTDSLKTSNLKISKPEGFEDLIADYREEIKSGIEGYCVQIYNGKRIVCLTKKTDFFKVYPDVPAEMVYEAPEYRIQVGRFRTKIEAEKFLNEIQDEFTGSFIVKTIIKLPKLN